MQITNQHHTEQEGLWEPVTAAEFYAAIIGFLRRQFTTILFVLLLCLAAGAAYILTTEARYTGHAILIVETPKLPLFQSEVTYAPPPDPASVETQLEILNSDDIALSVIKDLRLDEDAEFVSPTSSILSRMVGLAQGAISAAVHLVLPRPQTSNHGSPEYTALQTFHQQLKVKRVGLTYAIEINFNSRNAFRAAQIANAIADAYELNAFQAKYQITDQAAKWLQERLQDLREQASDAERAVVDYKDIVYYQTKIK
jgi:succinoglycan biosynthesis transport protein ExoP